MIGVDANVVLRHVLQDDSVWSEAATRFLRETCSPSEPGFVNAVTLAEIAWVLRRRPNYDRAKLAFLIEALLTDEHLVLGSRTAVVTALDAFRRGPAGFADYLVAALNEEAGATPTYTIDKGAARHPPFERLT